MYSQNDDIKKDKNLENVYRKIKNDRLRKYGNYHKCVFHLHTPQSHDYKLLGDDNYNTDSLFKLCKDKGIFPQFYDISNIKYDELMFEDLVELLSFVLVAYKLIEMHIELVVITDHNTIAGIDKLKKVLDLLKQYKSFRYPKIISGIEISCADRMHVVGIFDDNTNINELQNWINEYIMNERDGTYETSIKVLEKIHELSGIGYIAHINSSNIFKKHLTGAYKKALFQLPYMHIIGVSELDKIEEIRRHILEYSRKEFDFVIDEDSHSLEEIGKKYFWIKGTTCNFQMIKKAIRDYNISVQFENPSTPATFIQGISIDTNEYSFLINKEMEKKEFQVLFSDSLNCFIGGRGTGKSTILKLINFVLNQECANPEELNFICNVNHVWILIKNENREYIVKFSPPKKEFQDEDILKYFCDDRTKFIPYGVNRKYKFDLLEIKDYALRNYIKIYEVLCENNKFKSFICHRKKELLSKLFTTSYSMNELVKNSEGSNIALYLQKVMLTNRTILEPKNLFNVRNERNLKQKLNEYTNILESRENEINELLEKFNKSQNKILRILYHGVQLDERIISFINIMDYERNHPEQYFFKYDIRNKNVYDYLDSLASSFGFIKLLTKLLEKDYSSLNKVISINNFCDGLNRKTTNEDIVKICESNYSDVLEKISSILFKNTNIRKICKIINENILKSEQFDLEFNINNKEIIGDMKIPCYKSITTLSLGQKVVAMFNFILGYSEFSNDYTPLIIDQPEDNLDNQYIYKNLVKQLRDIKSKRQVILATHNSTIVTNAKAEQVIVMDSNGENGWISASGYPNENKMINMIINHLEGGITSFKHKQFIYSEVLNKNNDI